jgi:hypothetical protein
VVSRAVRSVRLGATVPAELTLMGNPRTVLEVLDLISRMIGRLKENTAALAISGSEVGPLVERGQQIYQALQTAECEQVLGRSSKPAAPDGEDRAGDEWPQPAADTPTPAWGRRRLVRKRATRVTRSVRAGPILGSSRSPPGVGQDGRRREARTGSPPSIRSVIHVAAKG